MAHTPHVEHVHYILLRPRSTSNYCSRSTERNSIPLTKPAGLFHFTDSMGDTIQAPSADEQSDDRAQVPSRTSAQIICQEMLKVLARKEVEQPMIWYAPLT